MRSGPADHRPDGLPQPQPMPQLQPATVWRRSCFHVVLATTYALHKTMLSLFMELAPALGVDRNHTSLWAAVQQARHAALWASVQIPAAALAQAYGAARLLGVLLWGVAATALIAPAMSRWRTRGTGVGFGALLAVQAALLGSIFPCVAALQAQWYPHPGRPRGVFTPSASASTVSPAVQSPCTEDIWAARSLGVGAAAFEAVIGASILRSLYTSESLARQVFATSISQLLACLCVAASVALHWLDSATWSGGGDGHIGRGGKSLQLRAVIVAWPARAAILSASAAGAGIGIAERFLSPLALAQGVALVPAVDLMLGGAEALARWYGMPQLLTWRRLASSLGPLCGCAGLLALLWRQGAGGMVGQPWQSHTMLGPGAAFLFVQAAMGFGSGFGCSYREVGAGRHAAAFAALGTVGASIGSAAAPVVALAFGPRRGLAVLLAHQLVAATVWWHCAACEPLRLS